MSDKNKKTKESYKVVEKPVYENKINIGQSLTNITNDTRSKNRDVWAPKTSTSSMRNRSSSPKGLKKLHAIKASNYGTGLISRKSK